MPCMDSTVGHSSRTRTDEPLINYKVHEGGIVEEVKQECTQVEMDLGLTAEKPFGYGYFND
jgi:hypothetical protein